MITTILFDLDGTLLPMDQELFVKTYLKALAARVAPLCYEPQALLDAVWAGTAAMVKNPGTCTNEEVFWNFFAKRFGEQVRDDIPVFEDFYRNEFQQAQKVCGYNPKAREAVEFARSLGFRVILATNPRSSLPSPPNPVSAGQGWNRKTLNSIQPTKIPTTASQTLPTIRIS